MLVLRYRQSQEFYKTLLLAQAQDSPQRQETFAKYRAAMFPDVARHTGNTMATAQSILDRAVALGPIVIRSSPDE